MALTLASRQWAERPPDQRYASLEALHAACSKFHDEAVTADVSVYDLHAVALNGGVALNGRANTPAPFTNWAFGQLCSKVRAPASYLRELPVELAVANLNHGLKQYQPADVESATARLLLHQNGGLTVNAFTSTKYERIWNSDITKRLIQLAGGQVWQPAPAAFDGSRGLYASDSDMFAFMVDSNRRIFEKAPGGGLSRGFFCWNSEVGKSSFGIQKFFYEFICGNHMVWGATDVTEVRIRHVGDANDKAFGQIAIQLQKYADSSVANDEARIQGAMNKQIAATKDEVLDALFGLRIPALSYQALESSYELAELHSDWYGSPRTVWGMANGITEYAKSIEHTDKRVELERASGKVMAIAF